MHQEVLAIVKGKNGFIVTIPDGGVWIAKSLIEIVDLLPMILAPHTFAEPSEEKMG